jgi:hypothetical protein
MKAKADFHDGWSWGRQGRRKQELEVVPVIVNFLEFH